MSGTYFEDGKEREVLNVDFDQILVTNFRGGECCVICRFFGLYYD